MGATAEQGFIAEIDAPKKVVDEFRQGLQVQAALAAIRQQRLAAACERIESRCIDGVGQLAYQIDPDVYWIMRHKFGSGCWRDKDFVRDCQRKGMLRRIRGRPDKLSLRVNGRKDANNHVHTST